MRAARQACAAALRSQALLRGAPEQVPAGRLAAALAPALRSGATRAASAAGAAPPPGDEGKGTDDSDLSLLKGLDTADLKRRRELLERLGHSETLSAAFSAGQSHADTLKRNRDPAALEERQKWWKETGALQDLDIADMVSAAQRIMDAQDPEERFKLLKYDAATIKQHLEWWRATDTMEAFDMHMAERMSEGPADKFKLYDIDPATPTLEQRLKWLQDVMAQPKDKDK